MSEQQRQDIVQRGFKDFAAGQCMDAGSNLYVNAQGVIETIHRTDVNNDGFVDIIVPNNHGYIERGPTWVYTVSAGGEWPRQQLPNDSGWMSRIVDLDGDGYPDLVVVNGENGVTSELTSYVYWGGPAGLTGERSEFRTTGAYDVAIVDADGDGRLDLIFPSAWVDHHAPGRPRPLQVFLQRDGRRFEDATARCGLTGIAAVSVAAGDLNGDGRPELVVANYRSEFEYDYQAYVYWGKAGRGFEAAEPLRLPTHFAQQVLLTDLDGDGRDEIIFSGGNEVWIYWNDAGNFGPGKRTILHAQGFSTMFCQGAVRVAAADVDGDGRTELILATLDGVEIRRADAPDAVWQTLPFKYATWVSAVDLDGDGRPEIIASRYENGVTYEAESAVFWNGPAGYSVERMTLLPTGGAMGNTAGELTKGGRPVVVFNNTMGGPSQQWSEFPIYVYLGNAAGEYAVERRLSLPTGGSSSYVLADLDLDGYPDLATTMLNGLRIFKGGPVGISPDRYQDLPTVCRGVQHVHVADFNHDGYLDLLAIGTTYDDKPETLAHSTTIFWGSAEGFSAERTTNVPTFSVGMGHLADVNRDGYLDFLTGDWREHVAIYYGGPDGFSADRVDKIPITTGWIGTMNVADINEDGWPDLIVTVMGHYTRRPTSFYIFYGGPDGFSHERSQRYDGNYSPGHINVADINNDGHLDLIVSAYSSAVTRVVPSQIFYGDGKRIDLEHPVNLPADAACAALVVDFNRDGKPDIMLACHRDDLGHQADSLIYWNGPDGFTPARTTRLPGMGPHYLSPHDHGNALTRQPVETFVSSAIALAGAIPKRLTWEGKTPADTALKFELRWAASEAELAGAVWQGPAGPGSFYERSGQAVRGMPAGMAWLQYRASFISLYDCQSPQLREVRLSF